MRKIFFLNLESREKEKKSPLNIFSLLDMLDMSSAYLEARVKLQKVDGTTLTNPAVTDRVTPANNVLYNLFKDCTIEINGIQNFKLKKRIYKKIKNTNKDTILSH